VLIIDENMFKLAKMQEALLKVSTSNKEENLNNYKKTVSEIDAKAFNDILEEITHIDEHNQSLEDELQFLERIKDAYDQLLQLQLGFKKICEIYGNIDLKLSDLSRLNIEYIENRINAIKGYLINLKNIEVNKVKLQGLNDQLIEEEKKKIIIDKKILELDELLRNNFCSAEGRRVVNGNLQYTSVISEYDNIDLDFKRLLSDSDYLNIVLSGAEKEYNETLEKVKAAELCYNSMLTSDSRQILNEINLEFLKIKYKVVMLKIVNLLSQNGSNYDMFVEKRKKLLDLIKYRLSCMEMLGMKSSIDPFSRAKVDDQLTTMLSLSDNSKVINNLRKEIGQLGSWTEEMLAQNNNYLITLSDTKKLIESNVGLSDINIDSVVSFDELLVKHEVAPNQVLSVRIVPSKLNMSIISQKTASVIKRVNQMLNNESVSNEKGKEESHQYDGELVPELVIVPSVVNEEVVNTKGSVLETIESEESALAHENSLDDAVINSVKSDVSEATVFNEGETVHSVIPALEIVDPIVVNSGIKEETSENSINENVDTNKNESLVDGSIIVSEPLSLDIFETVTPFESPALFSDRADDDISKEEIDILQNVNSDDLKADKIIESKDLLVDFPESSNNDELGSEMPEAFWVTQESVSSETEEEGNEISFDDQINALLSSESGSVVKSRRM